MRKIYLLCSVFAVCLAMLTYTETEAKAAKIVLGYTTGEAASYQSLTAYHHYINAAALDTYAFNQKGDIIGDTPKKQLSFAKKKRIKTWAVISILFTISTGIWHQQSCPAKRRGSTLQNSLLRLQRSSRLPESILILKL
ncbi:hypothetical protein P9D36_19495 [Bacillus haynesii]|nr:hypothetical protein [Bacillus haynesii]